MNCLRLPLAALIAAAALPLAFVGARCAQAPTPIYVTQGPAGPAGAAARTVTVSGSAEVLTAPDEIEISVGVDTRAGDPQGVKNANDQIMRGLLAATKARGIDPKQVLTEHVSLQPIAETDGSLRHYEMSRTLHVTVGEVELAESILADFFARGANRLDHVTFRSSKAAERRVQARAMAADAARDKASALAATLGAKLGRPVKIDEGSAGGFSLYGQGNNANVSFNNDTRPSAGDALASGKIHTRADVSMTFELLDG